MNNEGYCKNVNEKLARLISEVRQDAKSNLHAINIHAEEFFRAFLNGLFGWELTNANAADPNAAGVDLLYPAKNIVVQVSGTTTREKLQSSLDKTEAYLKKHPNGGQKTRFCFVAVDDHLPDYRKPYAVPDCLTFNPETDLFDTARLHDRVVHCKDRDGKQAIDIQRELSELADKYFERQERRKALDLPRLGREKARTDYEYNAGVVPLLGRDREKTELLDFVRGDEALPFRWWAITAPGAAGKTRLAYELQEQLLAEGGWEVVSLPPAVYREENGTPKLFGLSDCYSGRTLVIADYVEQHAAVLGQWMKELSAPGFARSAPLRLLLLERDLRDEKGRLPWLEQIRGADYHIRERAFRPEPLALRPLAPAGEADRDPLLDLIRTFADYVLRKEPEEGEKAATRIPLPPGGETAVRARLDEVDETLVRPLFAMMLADAWVRDPAAPTWSREKLLQHIVGREWGFVAARLEPYHDEGNPSLCDAVKLLWMSATVLGAGGANAADPETLKTTMEETWSLLEDFAGDHKAKLRGLGRSPGEALLKKAGLLEGGRVSALRPDLLGEFLVVRGQEAMTPEEAAAFFAAILSDHEAARVFFLRVLRDYDGLVRTETGYRDWLFPAGLDLREENRSDFVRLLRRLFDGEAREGSYLGAKHAETRAWLAARMGTYAETFAEENHNAALALHNYADVLQEVSDYEEAAACYEKALAIEEGSADPDVRFVAAIINNLAGLYRAMGEYPKALEYQEKALAIWEKVLDPDHPDTATSYNNLALVYQAVGDYPKALKYNEKALAIWEKVLGSDHPSTATSYNNLAGLYRALGDYPKALEYHKKALAIREKVLGPDHPNTASSYNNLALVYQAMGDLPKALEYFKKDLAISEKVLGPDHPDTARSYNNLASVYQNMGDLPKALEYFKKDLAISEKVLGPDHPDTAITCNNIGRLCLKQQQPREALPWLRRALAVFETVLGPEHPYTKIAQEGVNYVEFALLMSELQRSDGAADPETLIRALLERLGPEGLAELFSEVEQFSDAEQPSDAETPDGGEPRPR